MKKIAVLVPLSILMAAAVWAFAAGDAGDPLVSLAYLNGTFTNMVETEVDQRLDAADAELLEGGTGLSSESAGGLAATWKETRLKQFDVLQGTTGTNVLVLAGGMQVTYSAGTVVDVTTGTTVSSGAALTKNHRYMVAEDTEAAFTVTSKTAVVDYQGIYTFSDSNAVDYNAMAAALKGLHLFKGTFTGYGEGFDLEAAPTRLQALIMFIRVLGEEEQALDRDNAVYRYRQGHRDGKICWLRLQQGLYQRLQCHTVQAGRCRQCLPVHGICLAGHGIQLRQQYKSGRYADSGTGSWSFDFR